MTHEPTSMRSLPAPVVFPLPVIAKNHFTHLADCRRQRQSQRFSNTFWEFADCFEQELYVAKRPSREKTLRVSDGDVLMRELEKNLGLRKNRSW